MTATTMEQPPVDLGWITQDDIIRFAELWYHGDGFLDMAKGDRLPLPEPWIADALKAAHEGDCTGVPAPCLRCHAEEQMHIASWVFPKFAQYLQEKKEVVPKETSFLGNNGCTCPCHKPGSTILHAFPCC